MLSRLITCNELERFVFSLKALPVYSSSRPATGWFKVTWEDGNRRPLFLSYTYYDRDYPEACVHLDLR